MASNKMLSSFHLAVLFAIIMNGRLLMMMMMSVERCGSLGIVCLSFLVCSLVVQRGGSIIIIAKSW